MARGRSDGDEIAVEQPTLPGLVTVLRLGSPGITIGVGVATGGREAPHIRGKEVTDP